MRAHEDKIRFGLRQRHGLPQREGHIGSGQYRTIVQAIADHGHFVSAGLQGLQRLQFVLGAAAALRVHDAHGPSHLGHSALTIA